MNNLLNTITAFVLAGVFIVLFIGLVTILAQVLFFGIIVGFVLYVIFAIRNKIFPNSSGAIRAKQARENRRFVYNFYRYQSNIKSKSKSKSKSRAKTEDVSEPEDQQHIDNVTNHEVEVGYKNKSQGRIIDIEPE